jgi:apolipoprotein N-acyltransferase
VVARLAALRGWRADVAGALLGALSAASLPPLHAIPVLLVAVPGLLVLIDAAGGLWSAARRGFWFGLGLHVLGLYWITEAILFEAARFWWLVPLAVPSLAAVLALFAAVPAGLAWRAPAGWRRVAALAGCWTLADLARQFVATGFPWNPLGSVWAVPGTFGDVFIQPAALVGVHGLTLLTLVLAATPILGRRGIAAGAVGLAAWAAFGVIRLAGPVPPPPGLTVVLVQGNVAQGQKWDRAVFAGIFERYLALTAEGLARAGDGPAVVVWPETASPYLLETDAGARAAIAEGLRGDPALIGAVRFDAAGRPRNSLFALRGAGPPLAVYDKWHLVPFGEYIPEWLPLPVWVVPGGGFAAGAGPTTFEVPGLPPFGALICYEAIFPGEIVDTAHRPAWLVNVTNDAWFGNSTGPRQHLAAARLRAVEEGLPLVRAANTGISAAFDARGHEAGRLGLDRSGTLAVPLGGALPAPLFALLGLWIPGALGLATAAIGYLFIHKHVTDRRKK